jgi:hypothetical protein
MAAEGLLDGEVEAITRKAIERTISQALHALMTRNIRPVIWRRIEARAGAARSLPTPRKFHATVKFAAQLSPKVGIGS